MYLAALFAPHPTHPSLLSLSFSPSFLPSFPLSTMARMYSIYAVYELTSLFSSHRTGDQFITQDGTRHAIVYVQRVSVSVCVCEMVGGH